MDERIVRDVNIVLDTRDVDESNINTRTMASTSCNHHNFQKPDICQSTDSSTDGDINVSLLRSRRSRQCGGVSEADDDVEIEELVEEIQELQVLNPSSSMAIGNCSTSRNVDDGDSGCMATSTTNQLLHAGVDADHNVFLMDDSTGDQVHRHSGGSRTVRIKHSVVVICDVSKMLTPVGLVKSFILLSCVVGLGCLWATEYPALVVSAPARFHIFSLTFTFLTVLVVFLLEILTLLLLFPINWPLWNALVHASVFLLLFSSSTILVHALFVNQTAMPRLDNTVEMIMISGISGYFGAVLSLMTSAMGCCCYDHHLTVPWQQHSEGLLLLK